MNINVPKTKEMLIHFGKIYPLQTIPNACINQTVVDRVHTFKLLGVVFNDHLTWTDHVSYIISKASKRIFCIVQLVKSGLSAHDVVKIYCSIIRSVLEYCCPVWHPGLTSQQSKDIEVIQKRCLKIIFPDMLYRDSLAASNLEKLSDRREKLTFELFNQIRNPDHLLHSLLTPRNNIKNLKTNYEFLLPKTKTLLARRDFINYCLFKHY